MASVWGELKRRNVVRVAIAYVIIAWLTLQVGDTLAPALHLGEWVNTALAFFLILGFPMALFFAWAFELTPEGLKKETDIERSESITHATGRKLDFAIIAMLVVALGFFAYDKFVLDPDRDAVKIEAAVQVAREEVASAVEPQGSAKTIAVLPFVNMSDDPNNEYFADGISEEILNLLANVRELRVTSRSSAFSFKGQNVDVPTMAAKLNVAHVLEGSVRKSGDQLRITAQLIDVATDTHLWSETYDRELKNVFAIQDEIAAAVVDALQIRLLGMRPKAIETDPEAYALYLQGRHFGNRNTAEASKQAETLLLQSLEIDSGFAPAWVALSGVYLQQVGVFGNRPADEGRELARHAAQQAMAADPQDGRAYSMLAYVEMSLDWDFVMASQHLQQALTLNPGDAYILQSAAMLEQIFGRVDKAIDLSRQSIVLDPLSGHTGLGESLYYAHRSAEAVDSMQMALSLNPDSARTRYLLGLVLLAQGDAAAALAVTEQVADRGYRSSGLAVVQHALGDTAASDSALRELIECCAANGAYQVAQAYAFRGETDDAFDWLGHAYDNRDPGLTRMLIDPVFTNLHNDPRWESILDKMGSPH